jgi:hypothetical protein
MTPMTYQEWCSSPDHDSLSTIRKSHDPVVLRQRYEAYLAATAFIRSQIGGLPYAAVERAI